MKNDTTCEEVRQYYAEKYGKREEETWDQFWMRVDRILISRARNRRRYSVNKPRFSK